MTATTHLLLAICFAPTVALLLWAIPGENQGGLRRTLALAGALVNLGLVSTTLGHESQIELPWLGSRFDLALRAYHTASVISTAAAVFGALVMLFSTGTMRGHRAERSHYALMLLTLGLVNGAVFANSLLVLLFFWEALLGTTYGLIVIGGEHAHRTATKAVVVAGVGDLCFMLGVALVWAQAKTVVLSDIHLSLDDTGATSFVLLMAGAMAKCGALPFHSWIPDAAVDAPAPFMAFLPASLEKLLGVYFLSRLTLDLYDLTPESWVSSLIMSVGAITLILAVFMAVVQDDYRKLLAYAAISQVGLILLGIGSATTVGIVGALFHLFNHATYKSGLFLTAAAVEHQTQATRLSQLQGTFRKMPVTFICFLLAAASGAGVPFFAGFYSKELIFDAVLESGTAFYLAAVLGSFLTTITFLKMGHAVFFGKRETLSATPNDDHPREAAPQLLIPMVVMAATTVLFGVVNAFPIERLVLPMLPERRLDELHAAGHHVVGWPANTSLVVMAIVVLLGALASHWFGTNLNGGASHATDHVRATPGLSFLYDRAERRWFDPYELLMKAVSGFAQLTYRVDRAVDWLFVAAGQSSVVLSRWLRAIHRGNTSTYILWSLVAATLVLLYLGQ